MHLIALKTYFVCALLTFGILTPLYLFLNSELIQYGCNCSGSEKQGCLPYLWVASVSHDPYVVLNTRPRHPPAHSEAGGAWSGSEV